MKNVQNVQKRNHKNVSKPEVTFVSRSRFVFLDVIVAIQISDWTDVGRVSSSDENENDSGFRSFTARKKKSNNFRL